jgi:hypothetical protein
MSVADLLLASRAAHNRKRQSTGKTDKHGVISSRPDYQKAEAHIAEALRLRLEAHALDPEHADPEWARDVAPHDELVAFYRQYPLIP